MVTDRYPYQKRIELKLRLVRQQDIEYLMPFGLKSAPSTFQRLLKSIFGPNWNNMFCLFRRRDTFWTDPPGTQRETERNF